jgi:hypothetical protein
MSRNLKATKIIVLGDPGQGSVSDAIKSVIEKECGITITEMLENQNNMPYVKVYNYKCLIPPTPNKIYFDKSKSKYHR